MSDETNSAETTATDAAIDGAANASQEAGAGDNDRHGLMSRIGDAWRDTVGKFAAGERETANLFSRLADFGTLTQQEAKKLIAETKGRIEANKNEIDRRIDASIKSATLRLSVPSSDEIAQFETELDALDARLDAALAKRG